MSPLLRLLPAAALLLAPFAGAQDEVLLEPEKAFAFEARAEADRIEATWTIADGYYMYRDKLRFAIEGGGAELGAATLPPGKIKSDEFFGDMETYVGRLAVSIPVERTTAAPADVTLVAVGQGCNEPVGVCYPPLTQKVALTLPAAPAAGIPGGGSGGTVSELRDLLGMTQEEPEFLSPDEAFKLDVLAVDGRTLIARFDIAEGYYLYRDKMRFERTGADGPALGGYALPAGKEKRDEFFGDTEVYYLGADITLPLVRAGPDRGSLQLTAHYQGCAESGICYPPVAKTLEVSLPTLVASAAAAELPGDAGSGTSPRSGGLEAGLIALVVVSFLAGIGLTFTPCVLPLVPILSSIIVGTGGQVTRARAGALSAVYVLGTAVTWTAAGAVAGATGEQLQAYFQNPIAIGVVVTIFVAMALAMFGLYEVQMPAAIQSRLQASTQSIGGGGLGVVFVLGVISALIVGACVSPVLISQLGIAIAKGDPWLGAGIMFAMALGMGVPLIAVGLGAGYLMPRAGPWMDRVKHAFGVALLAVAIYLLGTLPAVPVLLLWAALLIITAVYLGATQALPPGAGGWRTLWKGAGTVMLVWGVLALVGGLLGNRDILDPIPQVARIGAAGPVTAASPANGELFRHIESTVELDSALAAAVAEGKPVVLDYYADWCVDCVRMENTTFRDPLIATELAEGFVALQIDVTDPRDESTSAVKRRYGVYGPPAMLFFSPTGEELRELRLYGYRGVEEFAAILTRVRDVVGRSRI